MSRACTPVLVGVVSLVSEIWLPFKNGQISLLGHGYSPWSWKNSIDRNWLKKFMQVGIDITCMHTSFGGCDPFSFGDMAAFQKRPNFPFGAWTIDILGGAQAISTLHRKASAFLIVHGHQKI